MFLLLLIVCTLGGVQSHGYLKTPRYVIDLRLAGHRRADCWDVHVVLRSSTSLASTWYNTAVVGGTKGVNST